MSVRDLENTLNAFFGMPTVRPTSTRKRSHRLVYSLKVHGAVYPIAKSKDCFGGILWTCKIDGDVYNSSQLRYLAGDVYSDTSDATLMREREYVPA